MHTFMLRTVAFQKVNTEELSLTTAAGYVTYNNYKLNV